MKLRKIKWTYDRYYKHYISEVLFNKFVLKIHEFKPKHGNNIYIIAESVLKDDYLSTYKENDIYYCKPINETTIAKVKKYAEKELCEYVEELQNHINNLKGEPK